MTPHFALDCRHEFADVPFAGATMRFGHMRVPKRPQVCGVLEKIGDTHLVDTTGHEIDRYEGLSKATLQIVGCDVLVAITPNGYAAGATEKPYVW